MSWSGRADEVPATAKHFGLLIERVEHSVNKDLLRKLEEGRVRNARGDTAP
jgi:hypothetical protein